MVTEFQIVKFSLPRIECEMPLKHKIVGSTGSVYEIDLNEFKCSCPDWIKNRYAFAFPDIRRACKHISIFLLILPLNFALPMPPCYYECVKTEIEGYDYTLVRKELNPWIDVKVCNRVGQIYDYGYNIEEKHWSYNTRPRHSKEIREIIFSWASK